MSGRLETDNDLLAQILGALGGNGATGIDDLNAAIGSPSDEAWSGDGDGTVIALLKAIAVNTTPAA